MSPEDEKYYEDFFEMFSTNGWKAFQEDIKKLIELKRNSVFHLTKGDDFFLEKGVMQTLRYIENLESMTRKYYDAAKEGTDADL